MSNSERRANLPDVIKTVEPTFTELARRHNVPDFTFAREAAFAAQILNNPANSFLANVACGNLDSLKDAIVNVAAVGLSLSPVHKQAYLVPRKGRVCLDISYQGFVDLATSRGAILWAKAELVHDKDQFEFLGINIMPKHKIKNVFGDRGPVIGGYCVAKMPTGDLLVDRMSLADLHKIRDQSEGWKAYKKGDASTTPWFTHEHEMMKKTLIRRAYKSWPKTVEALSEAVNISNETEGLNANDEAVDLPDANDAKREIGLGEIRNLLEVLDRDEPRFLAHLNRETNRQIVKLEDLTTLEIEQQIIFLEGLVDEQAAKIEKRRKSK
jgi:recombination protein RecT